MPRPSYPPALLALIQSTTYPGLPNLEELEALKQAIIDHADVAPATAISTGAGSTIKVEKKDRDRRKGEELERAALEANEKSGARLEAVVERARAGGSQGVGQGAKGSPGPGSSSMGAGHGQSGGSKVKRERISPSPAPSNASSVSFRPQPGSQPITYSNQLKKKKTKRVLDSDDEGRDRSATIASPPPPLSTSTSSLKLKIPPHSKPRPSHFPDPSPTPTAHTPSSSQAGASIDFSLPPPIARPLVPLRPGIQKPPKPGPKRQSEVDEDFSNTKAPTQVAMTAFWSGMEAYIRDIREDDLAMLNFKADAPESFEIPPRGRHYSEVWDEEDGNPPGTTPRLPVPNTRHNYGGPGGLGLPHFVPASELKEELLVDEHRGLGHLTERIVAGVMDGEAETEARSRDAREAAYDGNREVMRLDVVDLEDRMKKELRGVMLLGEHEEFDPSNREDDEITSALRQCQRALLQQTQINEARKSRLAEVAKHRLAYGEYHSALDGIEKAIEAGWAKRIKRYGSTPKRSSNANASANGNGNTGTSIRPPIPEGLKKLVQTRRRWLETVGQTMKERPKGEVIGMPDVSVYEGIGEEMDAKDEKFVEEQVNLEMDVDEGLGA